VLTPLSPPVKKLTKNKTKDMILDNLKEIGIHVTGTVAQLKEIARRNNIPPCCILNARHHKRMGGPAQGDAAGTVGASLR
jgi:hypothetical protein